ncbi:MAG: hypothetical protein QM702_00090 [Rubrivivax sp.]
MLSTQHDAAPARHTGFPPTRFPEVDARRDANLLQRAELKNAWRRFEPVPVRPTGFGDLR